MGTNQQIKIMFLNLPRDEQIDMLENSPSFGVFFELSKIALDAPITSGGIPTEMIEQCRLKAQDNWI